MKINYKVKILILSVLILISQSCDNKLDLEPTQSIDATTALETDQDIQSAIIGAYSIMGGPELYGTNLNILPELLAGDDYFSWTGTFQSYRQVNLKQMVADNAEATRTWIEAYNAINVANTVLDASGIITDEELKATLEGEAYFIRGLMHFELVRLYALPYSAGSAGTNLGVPIVSKATKTSDDAIALSGRKTVEEVYTQVIADLTQAIDLLPEDNGTRADKYSALAVISRVYLQQEEYQGALDAATQVIESSGRSLTSTVSGAFTNKNSTESLFEIQQNDQNNAGTSNDGLATFYASLEGIGRADFRILNDFTTLFNENDLRLTELIYQGVGARPNRFYSGKWTSFGQNIPVIRLAEMYLTRAECNIRLNSAIGDTPANDINLIRERAEAPPIEAPTIEDVLNERIFELSFEGSRIHDFKRTKRSTGDFGFDAPELVFPIPDREIRANSQLVQNPGYL